MLTSDDLKKIGEVVDQRFDEKLEPIKKDIKSLKNGQKKLRKDLSLVLKYSDGASANHEKRITRIEDHLHLPSIE